MWAERGQATVEWVGLVALVVVALGAALAVVPASDGRSLGGAIVHRMACVLAGDCRSRDTALVRAYGRDGAALVRDNQPGLVYEPGERQLPVDWRECRDVGCATASPEGDIDVHRSDTGMRATAFTRLVSRGGRRYVQYWFYYPDSNSAWAGSDWIWRHSPHLRQIGELLNGSAAYPGYHRDDWESVAVALDGDGRASTRVSSHGHWQWCKFRDCKHWGPFTGWSRVSRGSHAGHVPTDGRRRPQLPGRDLRERTSSPDGIRLVPLESIDRRRYRRLDPDIAPPWSKDAYANPESPAA